MSITLKLEFGGKKNDPVGDEELREKENQVYRAALQVIDILEKRPEDVRFLTAMYLKIFVLGGALTSDGLKTDARKDTEDFLYVRSR